MDLSREQSRGDESSTGGCRVSSEIADHSDDESSSTSSEPPGTDGIHGDQAQDVATESRDDARTDVQSSQLEGANETKNSNDGTPLFSLRMAARQIFDRSDDPPGTNHAQTSAPDSIAVVFRCHLTSVGTGQDTFDEPHLD